MSINNDIRFDRNCENISNFHPFEVVGRGSETQLQVDDQLYDNLAVKWWKETGITGFFESGLSVCFLH